MQGDLTSADDAATRIVVRHRRDARDTQPLDQALIGAEKERPVTLQGPAQDAAELMAGELRLGQRLRIEEISRVERGVAVELEDRSGVAIRTGARDGVEDAAGRPPEF